MSTTLTNGLKLPDKGSVDWYADMQNNYTILDGAVGTVAEHTSALSGKAPLVHTHTKADITDLFNSANEWTGDNTYTATIKYKTSYTLGNPPQSSDAQQSAIMVTDSAGTNYLAQIATFQSADATGCRITIRDKFDSNGFSPSGSNRNKYFYLIQNISNQGYLKWDGYINNSIYPLANNTYDLGSSSYQWNNLYAKNYYYDGTAWGLDKSNEWTKNNTWTSGLYSKNTEYTKGTLPSTNKYHGFAFIDSAGNASSRILRWINANGSNGFSLQCWNEQVSTDSSCAFNLGYTPQSVSYCSFDNFGIVVPNITNATDLGTSSLKWKTLNGVNPGALSLPDSANSVNIDITNWNKRATNSVIGSIAASMNGWINVQIQRDVDFAVWVIGTYRQLFRAGIQSNGKYLVMFMFPVTKNATVTLYTLPLDALESDLVFGVYRFYPCLGNV